MITAKITGGLGNQLFQYAAARSLAYDLNTDLYLDISHYSGHNLPKHVKYLLNNFNIKIDGYTNSFAWKMKKKIKKLKKEDETIFSDYEDVYGTNSTYKPQIKNLKGNIYLDGYWGNEKYFIQNKNIIKRELQLKKSPNKKNKKILEEISSVNSIALTVRRKDYLDPYFKAQFGFCTLSYYREAIKKIVKETKNPIFYIFSDDPEWVKKNIILSYPTYYISHNYKSKEYWEDLRLISSCKHFIMANSTFSWWGSLLGDNNSIIIGPKPWLNSYTTKDIMPRSWKRIKCDRSEIFENSKYFSYKQENIELKNNKKLRLNPEKILIKSFEDNIIRIVANAEFPTLLKISNENIPPILLRFEKGISIRYIYLDKTIDLHNLIITNESENKLKIVELEIKNVKYSISKRYKN